MIARLMNYWIDLPFHSFLSWQQGRHWRVQLFFPSVSSYSLSTFLNGNLKIYHLCSVFMFMVVLSFIFFDPFFFLHVYAIPLPKIYMWCFKILALQIVPLSNLVLFDVSWLLSPLLGQSRIQCIFKVYILLLPKGHFTPENLAVRNHSSLLELSFPEAQVLVFPSLRCCKK